jgi:hydrogenase maturation factor
MKLEIWCKSRIIDNAKPVLAQKCEWGVVPRVGDYVIIHDGWASEMVLDVHHDFANEKVLIEIAPDTFGEYSQQAALNPEQEPSDD